MKKNFLPNQVYYSQFRVKYSKSPKAKIYSILYIRVIMDIVIYMNGFVINFIL